MTIDFICEELAELFDSPCNYSPVDEKMFQDSYCESHCGKITDKECWKQYFEKVWADRKTEQTEPQTYITEDRDTQILDAWQVKLKAEQTEPQTETQTETQNSNENSNVILVYDGVSEAVRCAMCSNPNKSDRGCDGACSYDERLYKRIMDAIDESRVDTPQTEGE